MKRVRNLGFCLVLLLLSSLAVTAGQFDVSAVLQSDFNGLGHAWVYTVSNLAPLDSGTSPAELWLYWPDPTQPDDPDQSDNPPDYGPPQIIGTPADWATVPGCTCPNWYATDDAPYPQQSLSGFAVQTATAPSRFDIVYYDGIAGSFAEDIGQVKGLAPEPSSLYALLAGFALAGPALRRLRA